MLKCSVILKQFFRLYCCIHTSICDPKISWSNYTEIIGLLKHKYNLGWSNDIPAEIWYCAKNSFSLVFFFFSTNAKYHKTRCIRSLSVHPFHQHLLRPVYKPSTRHAKPQDMPNYERDLLIEVWLSKLITLVF